MSQPPTDANHSPNTWLNPAARAQLERDLDDLPDLMDQLQRNYPELLAAGDTNPDDHAIRYPIATTVLDLHDTRTKHEDIDAAGLAQLDRLANARRLGVLPSLELWLTMLEADMLDANIDHTPPAFGTTTTAAGWLRNHLDWISTRQEVQELAIEVRGFVTDLEHIVGKAYATPDETTIGTIREIATRTGIPASTLWQWARQGWLTPLGATRHGAEYSIRQALDLRATQRVRHTKAS